MNNSRQAFLPRGFRGLLLSAVITGLLVVLPVSPAAAGDMTVNVTRSGLQQGTVTDDWGQINCGSVCAAFYPDESCAPDPETGVTLCDGIEATLTTTVPPGFQASWSGCGPVSTDGRSCTVSNYTRFGASRNVAVSYLDVTDPVVSGLTTNPFQNVRDSVTASVEASDNDEVSRVEFRLDGALAATDTSAPYGATIDTSSRPDGTYTLTVTSFDRSGRSSTPVMRSLLIDHTAPVLTVDGPGYGFTSEEPQFVSSSSPAWSFQASDTGSGTYSLYCMVDGVDQECQPGDGTFTATGLSDGPHWGYFVLYDEVGNSRVSLEWHIVVDTIAPQASITSGPRRPVALSRNATFEVAAEDANDLVFGCALDSDEFTPCDDAPAYTGLTSGSHRFQFTAMDPAENQDWEPASWTWTVPHDDRTLTASSGWKKLSASRYYLGTARTTKAQKAALSMGSVRARELYLVASTVPGGGTVDVFHGSKLVKRVKLASATTRHQRVIKVASYDAISTARKLRIVVVTARKPVTIDGVAVVSK